MASVDIERLMQNLRVRLPGAIDDAIKFELFNTLNDFFQGSNIWREDIPVPITPGVKTYPLIASGPAAIVRLMGVIDNNSLPVDAVLDLDTRDLVLTLDPSSAVDYTAQVSLTVDDPVDRESYPIFPIWVLNLYINDIIDGVLGRMMSQPAKPYSNTQLAAYHTRSFTSAISAARAEANRKYAYGAQRWRFPQTFNRYKARR